jgi:hypothetical protein
LSVRSSTLGSERLPKGCLERRHCNQSFEFMKANFGKAGSYYYCISRGVDNREVVLTGSGNPSGPKTPSPAISQRPVRKKCTSTSSLTKLSPRSAVHKDIEMG